MKLSEKIVIALGVFAAAGVVIYITRMQSVTRRKLAEIADEGYETAQDILFPGDKLTRGRLHYGPVIPE